jgi:predicted GNAT family acetyltransferase
MVEFARVLDVLVPPHVPTQGAPRTAVPSDIDLLIDWLRQFCIDAGLPGGDEIRAVEARIAQAALWLWVRDDEPVAMAGHAPLVTTSAGVVGRIGPVYTPRHLRGRGYASAVTAAVAQSLLPRCSAIMLFSDAANASSNGIYERLGFRTVAEIVETTLR